MMIAEIAMPAMFSSRANLSPTAIAILTTAATIAAVRAILVH